MALAQTGCDVREPQGDPIASVHQLCLCSVDFLDTTTCQQAQAIWAWKYGRERAGRCFCQVREFRITKAARQHSEIWEICFCQRCGYCGRVERHTQFCRSSTCFLSWLPSEPTRSWFGTTAAWAQLLCPWPASECKFHRIVDLKTPEHKCGTRVTRVQRDCRTEQLPMLAFQTSESQPPLNSQTSLLALLSSGRTGNGAPVAQLQFLHLYIA